LTLVVFTKVTIKYNEKKHKTNDAESLNIESCCKRLMQKVEWRFAKLSAYN
jgi:hypothetical protein